MHRPRLRLSLPNPQRRLRDRLLAAMLVVALVPAGAFFIVTVVNLHGITQSTVNGAVQSSIQHQEQTLQHQLGTFAASTLNAPLQALQGQIGSFAESTSAAVAAHHASASVAPRQVSPAGRGVSEVALSLGTSAASVQLLVGSAPSASTLSVEQRAACLAGLAPSLASTLAQIRAKPASGAVTIDSVWVEDPADNAVLVSTAPTNVDVPGLATNPQGAPPGVLPAAGSGGGCAQPGEPSQPAAPSTHWTEPYLSRLLGGWEVSVASTFDDSLVVGADVPLAQFASMVASTPTVAHSYPLLLATAGGRVTVVAAPAKTGRDFRAPLELGAPLPLPTGSDGGALLAGLSAVLSLAASAATPLEAVVGSPHGVDKVFFTTIVADPGWALVEAAPKQDFEPNVSALSQGINKALSSIFQEAVVIAGLLLLLCFVLATVLSRLVVAPVRALTRSAERLAQGHVDEPVPPQGHSEVGDLAASLEHMRHEINASREVILAASRELEEKVEVRTAELRARNEELLALNALAGSLTRSLDPEAILSGALEAVRAVMPVTAGRSFVVSPEGGLTAIGPATEERGPVLEEMALAAHRDNLVVTRRDEDGTTLVGIPFSTGAGVLGALGVRSATLPGPEMTALLVAIGNQVGLALRTARLSQEGREMAVLEERARLAREIHDTLAQQLTGIVIQLEACQALASRDPERSLPALATAQEQARAALAEARRSVWDLRPAPLTSTGLVAAAEAEVERFRRRTGISARLRAERMSPPPALRPQAEVALLRITQQALANIAAHSGASRVSVRLRHLDHQVELAVKDNGHGFDVSSLPPGSFGIVGMAERVRLVGGTFDVESVPGRGTTVIARFPVMEEGTPAAGRGQPPLRAVTA